MRDAYVGDITDLIKLSLLRTLAGDDRQLGIAWYYLEGRDNQVDGRHLEWCDQDHWELFDPDIHAWLRPIAKSDRRVKALEDSAFWPNASFFSDIVPNRRSRTIWSQGKRAALEHCDLIFLDPDNGVRDGSRKHAALDEIKALHRDDRTIICISFPHFSATHAKQVAGLHTQLHNATGSARILTIRTSVSVPAKKPGMTIPRARWFTIIGYDEALLKRIERFQQRFSSLPRASATIERLSLATPQTAGDPLLDLAGSGSNLWTVQTADEYVRALRDEWSD